MNQDQEKLVILPDEQVKKRYGFFTATTMIVGIVIGSGIFFKTDNILIATHGNVLLGVILFCFAAIAIVFGSLTIAELASRSAAAGGIMNYADTFLSPASGSAYGWFQTFVYLPTICCILAWVGGIYTLQLFGAEQVLEWQILIGLAWMLFFFGMNIVSAKASGFFQNASTIIKIIPLLVIAIFGITKGQTASVLTSHVNISATTFFFSIPAVAFSFDGWIIATSISHEVRDSKKTMPKALVISPIIILILYILYFVGMSSLIGPHVIMDMGDASLDYAAQMILGDTGAKIINVALVISVVGGLNGLTMGMSQMPYSLGIRKMMPKSDYVAQTNPKTEFPVHSVIVSVLICLVWMVIHYLTQHYELLYNSDVSEIAICVSYIMYLPLYYKVFKSRKDWNLSAFRGTVCPFLASVGSLIIFCGGLQNQLFVFYILFCMVFIGLGYWYYKHITLKQL